MVNRIIILVFLCYIHTILDIRSLLCEHELLKYDPLEKNTFCINPSLPTKLVTEEEWVKIKEL